MQNKNLQYIFDLIVELVKKELKVRYKNSVLGYLWSVLSPLCQALVFFIAFKIVIRLKIENYVLFLIAGLFCWQWYTNSVFASTTLFLNNSSLIKKVNFPRETLVYSMVLHDLIHFVLALPVVFLFMVIYRQQFSWYILFLPILFVLQFLLISGICLVISSINLFFRDLERLVVVFTNLLFYMTPIIYSEDMVPLKYKIVLWLNPMSYFVTLYRQVLMFNRLESSTLIISAVYSSIIFFVGYKIYKSLEWRFAEVV